MNETPNTPTPADSGECERLRCKGCGNKLLAENCWMQDGCPCNTPRGVNDGNQQISDWRQEREQKASYECERLRAELAEAAELNNEMKRLFDQACDERDAAVGVLSRLPHTADGVPVICDGMTLFCPKGHANKMSHAHHRVYCCTGECWDNGCQGDSGSGTGYSFDKCYATAKGGGA